MSDTRAVIVTGASQGIGWEIAHRLAAVGYAVVGVARHAPDDQAPFAQFYTADITDTAHMRALVASIDEQHTVYGLVNNAAYSPIGPFLDVDLDTFDAAFDLNVRAMYALTQNVARSLVRRRAGSIVNLSSIHGQQGYRGMSVYGSTKGAIDAFTRHVAAELAEFGVRCNAIAPSATSTERLMDVLAPEQVQDRADRIPLGRLATPGEVADATAFLLSDDSRFITGATIPVDGGYLTIKA